MKKYYAILGVTQTATVEEIKKAYRKLAKSHHPDKNGDSVESKQRFQEIQEAYEVLSDEGQRAQYDFQLAEEARIAQEKKSKQQTTYHTSGQYSYSNEIWKFVMFYIILLVVALMISSRGKVQSA